MAHTRNAHSNADSPQQLETNANATCTPSVRITRELTRSHGDAARSMLARFAWLELRGDVLERGLHPFPTPVRTLDALHLASVSHLERLGREPELATYDRRMREAAGAMGLRLYPL